MLIPLPLAIDEVTASLQYLRSKQKPLFALLIQGGPCPEAKADTRSLRYFNIAFAGLIAAASFDPKGPHLRIYFFGLTCLVPSDLTVCL